MLLPAACKLQSLAARCPPQTVCKNCEARPQAPLGPAFRPGTPRQLSHSLVLSPLPQVVSLFVENVVVPGLSCQFGSVRIPVVGPE